MDVFPNYRGADIPTQIDLSYKQLYPILESKASEIESAKLKTFKYGPTYRHQLDVYYPSSTPTGKAPILVFVYGGGYHSGDRQMAPPRQLVYKNVGAFFAKRGLVTVIPDYRTLPIMKFPDPIIDVKDALEYINVSSSEINADAPVEADVNNIFVMAHSAGAAILSSLLLLPDVLPTSVRSNIRGVILKGGTYHFHTKNGLSLPPPVLMAYYGTQEDVRKHEPLGLLHSAPDDVIRALPELAFYESELEVASISESHHDFIKALSEKSGRTFHSNTMKGHNHISPHIALSTGQGEEWALEVIDWVKARVAK